jgi:hypothetical protein
MWLVVEICETSDYDRLMDTKYITNAVFINFWQILDIIAIIISIKHI